MPVLPRFVGIDGYSSLDAALKELGFRHAADMLSPASLPGSGRGLQVEFRVLDGLWFPARRGLLWRRADQAYIDECRAEWAASGDPRGPAVTEVLAVLAEALRDDPMALRRLVLWQLACLLKDGGPGAAAAEGLGVHRDEAGPLAAAVAADFPGEGPARRAGERIAAAARRRLLHEAARLAADIPDASADHALAHLVAAIRDDMAAADRLMGDAVRLQERGDADAAARAWLRAHRLIVDDPRASAGLLGAAASLADAPNRPGEAAVRAVADGRTVRLSWPAPASPDVSVRVVRFPEDAPHEAVEVETPDDDVPAGVRLRYAVVPLHGDRIAEVPHATGPVLLPPEVTDARASSVPDGVHLEWQPHPRAGEVKVMRSSDADGAQPVAVPCGPGGLVDRPLEPGSYRYVIACRYTGLDGRDQWSPGCQVSVQVQRWPAPVEEATVRPVDGVGRVDITWRPPPRGEEYLVPWPFRTVRPGEDVSELFGRLPGEIRNAYAPQGPAPSVALTVPPRQTLRLALVSVLGDLAVSGPTVVIENPGGVADLAVRRLGPDRAEVRFTWPDPAVLVLLRWQRDGLTEETRIPRSRHLADGRIVIPVSRQAGEVTVTPLPRPDAVVVACEPATAVLEPAPEPVLEPAGARRPTAVERVALRPEPSPPPEPWPPPGQALAPPPRPVGEARVVTGQPTGGRWSRLRRWLRRLIPRSRG
ncbi:hypothetical protein [Actinomadura sp. NBRC 104425]|uniref:hypothetical protein n=1 Tax=Actinomadura sp. NBRC 104425 TaxID=3032204 RepID=UPI0025533865|nr:hypothetical protein [Actinomadura sp. NBRC 104425]